MVAARWCLAAAGTWFCAAWLAAACCAAAEGAPGGGVLAVTLDKAVGGQRELEVWLDCRGGKPAGAVALAPTFSKSPPQVDISRLTLHGAALGGELAVTFHSDGFNPPIGKTVRAVYSLNAKLPGGKGPAAGTFSGKYDTAGALGAPKDVAGAVTVVPAGRAPLDGLAVVTLSMVNAAGQKGLDRSVWGRAAYPRFVLKDGKVVQAVMHGHGGKQIEYFEAVFTRTDLKLDTTGLSGTAELTASGGDKYIYTLQAAVGGTRVAGTFGKTVNGKAAEGNRFTGVIEPVPQVPADNAVWNIELIGAVPGGKHLNVYLPCVGGTFRDGMAYAGTWNHTYHDVVPAALKLATRAAEAAATGKINVTMNPDPYVPADHKPVAASYDIDAAWRDGCVSGTFKGVFGGKDVAGAIVGRLTAIPPVPEPAAVSVKLDNGTCDGAPWHRRTYINFVAVKGKADAGGMGNNKGGWQGTFKGAEIAYGGATFTATIRGTVDTSHSSKTGAYTFKLTGKSIGGELIGKCDTYLDGKLAKQNTDFMGTIRAADAAP